jgi:hypothetical protein
MKQLTEVQSKVVDEYVANNYFQDDIGLYREETKIAVLRRINELSEKHDVPSEMIEVFETQDKNVKYAPRYLAYRMPREFHTHIYQTNKLAEIEVLAIDEEDARCKAKEMIKEGLNLKFGESDTEFVIVSMMK